MTDSEISTAEMATLAPAHHPSSASRHWAGTGQVLVLDSHGKTGTAEMLVGMAVLWAEDSKSGRFQPCFCHSSYLGLYLNSWPKNLQEPNHRLSIGPIWLWPTGRVPGHYKPEKHFLGPELGNPNVSLVCRPQSLTSSSFLPGNGMECLELQWGQRDMVAAVK